MSFIVTVGGDEEGGVLSSLLNNSRDVLTLKSPTAISLPRKRVGREGHPSDN